jgi:hypothetical protein
MWPGAYETVPSLLRERDVCRARLPITIVLPVVVDSRFALSRARMLRPPGLQSDRGRKNSVHRSEYVGLRMRPW